MSCKIEILEFKTHILVLVRIFYVLLLLGEGRLSYANALEDIQNNIDKVRG